MKKHKITKVNLFFNTKGKHRNAKRNNGNPQNLYDEIIYSEPLLIDNYRPPLAYRNGIMHDAMDTNTDLKWDTKE